MKNVIFLFIAIHTSILCLGQLAVTDPLFQELKEQDSIFFERGFNQCDLSYLEKHISDDLIFYHDQSGFQDRSKFFENTRKYICVTSGPKPIRKIDVESLEVFPLYNNGILYGAIQKGIHSFYLREPGKKDQKTSQARFTTVWIKKENTWLMSNVLSYDHH